MRHSIGFRVVSVGCERGSSGGTATLAPSTDRVPLARGLQYVWYKPDRRDTIAMTPHDDCPRDDTGFSLSGHPDPYTAGEAVLDRAKSVAQRIADRVRDLTGHQGHSTPPTDVAPTEAAPFDPDPTDEHTPLPE